MADWGVGHLTRAGVFGEDGSEVGHSAGGAVDGCCCCFSGRYAAGGLKGFGDQSGSAESLGEHEGLEGFITTYLTLR